MNCESTYTVWPGKTLHCDCDAHYLANPFIPRLGVWHGQDWSGQVAVWNDSESDQNNPESKPS